MHGIKRPPREIVWELMRKVENHVPGAEKELLVLLSPWLRDLIRKWLEPRVRRFEDSEDVLQEALLVVAKSFGAKHGVAPERFFHYLERVIHHLTISANRRHLDCRKRQDGSELDFSAEFNDEHQPLAPNPEPIAEAQAHETLDRLVEKAPEPLRTILRMKLQGFSNQEIAKQVNSSERTIRKIVAMVREHERQLEERGAGMNPIAPFCNDSTRDAFVRLPGTPQSTQPSRTKIRNRGCPCVPATN